jgi:cystathionine beta-synthase
MAHMEGLLVGGSCGTAMAAALSYAQRLTAKDLVVVMCPDTGRNYLSKMYSDEWMIEKGFMKPGGRSYTVGELLADREQHEVISVAPDDKAEDAISLLRQYGISQLPVIEGSEVVGCIRELTLARLLHSGTDPRQVPIREIMARPMPVVEENVSIDEVYRLLSSGHSGVVVRSGADILGVVTRIDLVNFWDAPFHDARNQQDVVSSG